MALSGSAGPYSKCMPNRPSLSDTETLCCSSCFAENDGISSGSKIVLRRLSFKLKAQMLRRLYSAWLEVPPMICGAANAVQCNIMFSIQGCIRDIQKMSVTSGGLGCPANSFSMIQDAAKLLPQYRCHPPMAQSIGPQGITSGNTGLVLDQRRLIHRHLLYASVQIAVSVSKSAQHLADAISMADHCATGLAGHCPY